MPPLTLVTGGSRGLGRNTALSIARKGGDVLITYRSRADAADAVIAEIEALGRKACALQLDMSEPSRFPAFADSVKAALQETWNRSSLDHLVNNAGEGINVPLAEIREAQFVTLFSVHVKGPLFLTQALLPLIADGGRIVNISSGLTRFTYPGYGAYAAAKGAVEVLTRYMAKELGPRDRVHGNAARHFREHGRAGRGRNRFRRRGGARHARPEPADRRDHRPRPGWPAG